jgi:hypothetical protein
VRIASGPESPSEKLATAPKRDNRDSRSFERKVGDHVHKRIET